MADDTTSDATGRRFSYNPINQHAEDRDVRLLTIDAAADSADVLSCRLHYHCTTDRYWTPVWAAHIFSNARPVSAADRLYWRKHQAGIFRFTWGDYYALSYTWGERNDVEEILLDDAPVKVTKNLAAALRAVRDQGYLPAGYHIWCDALCINQVDAVERGFEVSRMKTIYTRALDTLVYLGHGDPVVDSALNFINVADGHWNDPTALQNAMVEYLKQAPLEIWTDLVKFIELPYWWRQWVMQEMAAGTGEKPMLYGDSQTTSEQSWQVFRCFNRRNRYVLPQSAAFWDAVDQFPEHKQRLLEVETFEKPGPLGIRKFTFSDDGSERWNTYQILSTARKNKASDPRDHVYGLLGLLEPTLTAKIKVDYASETSSIYQAFVKTLVETEQSLEILGQCDINGTPSWTPRFDINFPWYRHPHHEQEAPMCAHAGRRAQVSFEPQSDAAVPYRLRTQAIILGTLDGLSSANLETDYNNENRLYKGGYAETMMQPSETQNAYGSEQALKNALWRTAGGNRDVMGRIPGPRAYSILLSSEILDESYHFNPNTSEDDPNAHPNPWAGWVIKNSEFLIAGKRLIDYFEPLGLSSLDEVQYNQAIKDGTDAVKRFTNACWSRRIATTNNGHICTTPWFAERNDHVAVLPGCSFPVLLRSVVESHTSSADEVPSRVFKVVCPCYVHGVMNGELWSKVDDGELVMESIVLI